MCTVRMEVMRIYAYIYVNEVAQSECNRIAKIIVSSFCS